MTGEKRKIRFRAWNPVDCSMEKPDWVENAGFGCAGMGWECWNESHRDWILMQFTGFLDQDDKAIFEGDIVFDGTCYHVVEWQELADNLAGWWFPRNAARLRIVGNVYETPEHIPASYRMSRKE